MAKHQSQCEYVLSQGLSSHLGHQHRDSGIQVVLVESIIVYLLYISIITYVISSSQQLPKEDICTNETF